MEGDEGGGGCGTTGGDSGGEAAITGAAVMAATVTSLTPPLTKAALRDAALAKMPVEREDAAAAASVAGTAMLVKISTEPAVMERLTSDALTFASLATTPLMAACLLGSKSLTSPAAEKDAVTIAASGDEGGGGEGADGGVGDAATTGSQ